MKLRTLMQHVERARCKNSCRAKCLICFYATICLPCLDCFMSTFSEFLEPRDWKLIEASQRGHVADVTRLLKICDVRKSNFAAFREAVRQGRAEVVELFVSTTIALPTHVALQDAVLRGYTTLIPLLIGERESNTYALQTAAELGDKRRQIIELLLPCSDYQKILTRMEHMSVHQIGRTADPTVLKQCIEEYECEQQRGRLEQAVTPATTSNVRKM